MTLRHLVPLAALGLLSGCAELMDDRQLPLLAMTDRTLLGDELLAVDGQTFTLRRYAETRAGMGEVTALYVLGPDAAHGPRPLASGVDLYTGFVNRRQFYSNFPGEWYCGQNRSACRRALEPEQIPLRFGEVP